MNGQTLQDAVDETGQEGVPTMDDETPVEERDPGVISPRQRRALEAFSQGCSLGDAAKAAGVTRQTLHRWRARYAEFGEAMSSWEAACLSIAHSHVVDMAVRATVALSDAIDKGDSRAAIMVLRSLRVLRSYLPGKPPVEVLTNQNFIRGSWPPQMGR
jgi:transposase-like protein